jgi:hypothetical protein
MSYAVVQKDLDAPSTEQLKNAFRGTDGLTEIDALSLGRDALGILARGFELELATGLQESLAREGIAAEVVEDASLPPLPETFALSHLDCTTDALLVYDSLGRVASLEWSDVWMIASGKVTVQEFREVTTAMPDHVSEIGYKVMESVDGRLSYTDPHRLGKKQVHTEVRSVDHATKEEAHDRHLLEIFLTGGGIRYSINADKAPLLFAYLTDRRTGDFSRNFNLVVQDLVRHAPHAALNRGANFVAENMEQPFFYPNKIAFYHEIIWLLWQASRIQPTAD